MMIVKTIIAIANYLGMETVAEGVEEISQLEALKAIGATMVQGFHTGRPMSPGEITDILAKSLKAKETNHGAK